METIYPKEITNQIQKKQVLRENYLTIWEQMNFFQTIDINNKTKIYENPSVVKWLMYIAEYLEDKYGKDRMNKIKVLQDINQVKGWIVQEYLTMIEDKEQKNQLTPSQKEVFEKEVSSYKSILEKVKEGNMITMPSFDEAFMPDRLKQAKIKNPWILEHNILTHTLSFIFKNKEMVSALMNTNWIKDFLKQFQWPVAQIIPILEALGSQDNTVQKIVFEHLIHINLTTEKTNEIINVINQCKQNNDYYLFIDLIETALIDNLPKNSQEKVYQEMIHSKDLLHNTLEKMHTKWPLWLNMLSYPNTMLRPLWYNQLENFLDKNDISLLEVLKQ